MAIFFISDNSFFLLGINETLVKQGDHDIKTFNINNHFSFAPLDGDIVIVSIKNLHMREKVMQLPEMRICRVMIMLSMPAFTFNKKSYPWLLRKTIGIKDLTVMINRAKKTPINKTIVSKKIISIFHSLGEGKCLREVSVDSEYSIKHLYQVKRSVIMRLGLSKYNALGILICRDLMHAIHINNHSNQYTYV